MIYTFRVSAFSFYLKKKTPAKEKQPVPTKRRTKFAPTVCKMSFSEGFMPLSRQRCVEVAAPYKLQYCTRKARFI